MSGNTIILMGSARTGGDTATASEELARLYGPRASVVALAPLRLQPFSYDSTADDAFVPLIEQVVRHDHVVFATPLYWYAMSGVMKTFFDRLTDLMLRSENRSLGRALAGRNTWALVIGTDPAPPAGMSEAFELTAAYFDMVWRGLRYLQAERHGGFEAGALSPLAELAAGINSANQ